MVFPSNMRHKTSRAHWTCLNGQDEAECGASIQTTAGYCPKTWEVSNKLTQTTTGNFCAGSKFSSMYSCAAICRWKSKEDAKLPDKRSYQSGQSVELCQCILEIIKQVSMLNQILSGQMKQIPDKCGKRQQQWVQHACMSCSGAFVL